MVNSSVVPFIDDFINEILDMSISDFIKLCSDNKIDISFFYESLSFTTFKLFMQDLKK